MVAPVLRRTGGMRERTPPDAATDPSEPQWDEDARLLLRLIVGAVAVSDERGRAALRSWAREVPTGSPELVESRHATRHRVVGALTMAPRYATRAAAEARSLYGRSIGRALGRVRRLALRTSSGRALASRAMMVRARIGAEAALWEAIGQAEETRGRALVEAGVDAVSHFAFQQLVASPELRELVAEQSAGVTERLVATARGYSVEADTRVESAIRRLLRRPRRRGRADALPAGE